MNTIFGVFAPARLPAPILQRLNREIVGAINNQEVRQRLLREASSDAGGSSPEQFASIMKDDIARMSKLIKDIGMREE
jgi:tripartite-type tricarboxylate transporter receptor subunit TctC